MTHTVQDKQKLVARVSRIRGQGEAIERALDAEAGCDNIIRLLASTRAGGALLAALAYTYARKYIGNDRFTFGTGKLGDLAGFTIAIVLAMIAMLIGYEAITRFITPVPIHFREAIPIAGVRPRCQRRVGIAPQHRGTGSGTHVSPRCRIRRSR